MARPSYFGPVALWPAQDLIAFTTKADIPLLINAYESGLFPMPLSQGGFGELGWWSPMRRGILPLDSLRVTRSMRQAANRYLTTVDADFPAVLDRCADPARSDGWIDDTIKRLYLELHESGIAHSVETWNLAGQLVGGLYGVSIGGLFAGESMFHDAQSGRDASKVALMTLVDTLSDEYAEVRIIDTQWSTPHLASLGVLEIDRDEYLSLLDELLEIPEPDWPVS